MLIQSSELAAWAAVSDDREPNAARKTAGLILKQSGTAQEQDWQVQTSIRGSGYCAGVKTLTAGTPPDRHIFYTLYNLHSALEAQRGTFKHDVPFA